MTTEQIIKAYKDKENTPCPYFVEYTFTKNKFNRKWNY